MTSARVFLTPPASFDFCNLRTSYTRSSFEVPIIQCGRHLSVVPLTALINGCTVDFNSWKKNEEEEQLQRIRSNIKEKRTMSNALLKVLMP